MRFSANLGLLWKEVPLPEAIRRAKQAGFAAIEFHWPYEMPVDDVKTALAETGLKMLGINTRRGDVAKGEFGLAAVPGREFEARAHFDEALSYAFEIGADSIHVLAGIAEGARAREVFLRNVAYACDRAAKYEITILIEPVNRFDVPDYFLWYCDQAAEIIAELNRPNLKMMFDCNHVGRTEGQVIERLRKHFEVIGHVQFASVPNRLTPDVGELDYGEVFAAIRRLGWKRPLAAEYKTDGPTEETLGWMKQFGAAR